MMFSHFLFSLITSFVQGLEIYQDLVLMYPENFKYFPIL
ncbi:hypothetical protein J699_02168 [Acinetobacter sp. 1000160]|nr:hypothetical protein J522_1619 [Acinetobacter baumannii 146457]EYT20144.1 hypothetical protein J699_02168 [Acinetobacter sp. 1000160]